MSDPDDRWRSVILSLKRLNVSTHLFRLKHVRKTENIPVD
jgi:hypothetical protein